jgi:hypothetical protein
MVKRMWKKAVVPCFKVQVFPGGSDKNTGNLSQHRLSPGRNSDSGPREYEAGVSTNTSLRSLVQLFLYAGKTPGLKHHAMKPYWGSGGIAPLIL